MTPSDFYEGLELEELDDFIVTEVGNEVEGVALLVRDSHDVAIVRFDRCTVSGCQATFGAIECGSIICGLGYPDIEFRGSLLDVLAMASKRNTEPAEYPLLAELFDSIADIYAPLSA